MRRLLLFVCLLLPALRASAAEPKSLLHDGDTWVCLGDSITAANCYPPLLQEVFNHYHGSRPGKGKLTVINSGLAGDIASDSPDKLQKRVLQYNPTVVSIMYGMNEAINYWKPDTDPAPIQDRYRASLTYLARTLRDKGITVLLMSPTPTDPTTHTYFTLEKTIPFLHQCAAIMRDVAKSEHVFYVPVQEDFEALRDSSPAGISLTADGVHPSSLGQYRIARSLWTFVGMDRELGTGKREVPAPEAAVPVRIGLTNRFVSPNANALQLNLTSQNPVDVTVQAGEGDGAFQQKLSLKPGVTPVSIPFDPNSLTRNGQSRRIFVDLETAKEHSLAVIDLCRTQVLHFADNKVSGTVAADQEGGPRQVGTWEAIRQGDDLLLNFEVFTGRIEPEGIWPFSRDGLNLMLDFRPKERFADIGVDQEVTQLFLNVREKPFFSVGLRAWTGHGMDSAATAAGERTATGYKVHLLIHDNFNLHAPVALSKRDFVGLLVGIAQHDLTPGKSELSITTNQKNDGAVSLYANNLMILDLKDQLAGDAVVNAYLSGG